MPARSSTRLVRGRAAPRALVARAPLGALGHRPRVGALALSAAVSLLLRLLGRDPDPAKSKEHVLLAVLAEQRLKLGQRVELAALLDDLHKPLMHGAHSREGTRLLQPRWALSFMRGPMMRTEIRRALALRARGGDASNAAAVEMEADARQREHVQLQG